MNRFLRKRPDLKALLDSIHWRKEFHAHTEKLLEEDLLPVLEAGRTRKSHDYYGMARNPNLYGLSLRIDLSRGLNQSAKRGLAIANRFGLQPWVLFPLVAAGDMGYAREGIFILSPEVVSILKKLADARLCSFGFLADPSACIGRVLNSVFNIWEMSKNNLKSQKIDIHGYGCSFHQNTDALANMLWAYRSARLLINTNWVTLMERLGFDGREWAFDEPPKGEFSQPCDGVSRAEFTTTIQDQVEFLRFFQVHSNIKFVVRLEPSFDLIAFTDSEGWKVLSKGGERAITAAELAKVIINAPPKYRIGIIVDPNDIQWSPVETTEAERVPSNGNLRVLPYPYHHYLAVNSDVDWSTHEHMDRVAQFVCDELGLPLGLSAYPFSPDKTWPAWEEIKNEPDREKSKGEYIREWASIHLLDTFHGLAHSFDTQYFFDQMNEYQENLMFDLRFPLDLTGYDGFIVVASTQGLDIVNAALPKISVLDQNGAEYHLTTAQRFADALSEKVYLLYLFAENSSLEIKSARTVKLTSIDPSLKVVEFYTAYATRPTFQNLLRQLVDYGFYAPVLTGHGGGEGTWRFGACITKQWASSHPEHAAMAFDRLGTPYYMLDELKKNGVYFYNPNDILSRNDLFDIQNLLKEENSQDGSSFYGFWRFFSTRYEQTGHSAFWTYGKHAATAQSFPAVLDDIIQRLHWLMPGSGCIIYTHLGHRIGNQVSPRLGWTEEMQSAWKQLAEFSYGCDQQTPVPFRIWFAAASSILTFAAVMRGLKNAIKVDGNTVAISSWFDKFLGVSIPAPQAFGTSWLHGITIYVPEPQNAQIWVDGYPITHFVCNPRDSLGGPSITLVDSSCTRAIIPGDSIESLETAQSSNFLEVLVPDQSSPTVIIPPPPHLYRSESNQGAVDSNSEERLIRSWILPVGALPLRNATHWTFEVFVEQLDFEWSLGFQTSDGRWFDAGSFLECSWSVSQAVNGGWKRWTFAFANPRGCYRPHGEIVAVRLRLSNSATADKIRFRDLSVVYPAPTRKVRPNKRILAGRICRLPDSIPLSNTEIKCHTSAAILSTHTDVSGSFMFHDLPDNVRCQIEVVSTFDKVYFSRGNIAYTSCDQWDWDIQIA